MFQIVKLILKSRASKHSHYHRAQLNFESLVGMCTLFHHSSRPWHILHSNRLCLYEMPETGWQPIRKNNWIIFTRERVGALVYGLCDETHVQKVVSLNPSTTFCMNLFSHLFVVRIVMFVWKDENIRKEAGDSQFKFFFLGMKDLALPNQWKLNFFELFTTCFKCPKLQSLLANVSQIKIK